MILKRYPRNCVIGEDVEIHETAEIDVSERLVLGDRTKIGQHCIIRGRDIEVGAEFWMDEYSMIGGGSCFEKPSRLQIGDQCHLGWQGQINTARVVVIGNEVGLGIGTKIFTHGAYLSHFEGFPVKFAPVIIEDRVWCPNATILPGVVIEHDTVVGAGSVVTKDIPAGCLAAGVPAKVVKWSCYPKQYAYSELESLTREFIAHFKSNILGLAGVSADIWQRGFIVNVNEAWFDIQNRVIGGKPDRIAELFQNELRRWGHRFRYYAKDGRYVRW